MITAGDMLLPRIQGLRRDLLTVRRAVWPTREAVVASQREASTLVTAETRVFLRDCYDHAVEALDIVETDRETASSVMEIYLATQNQRLNEVMKVLTVIATLFIPLTFIASIYGMNFEYMPELAWRWGYPSALGLMAAGGRGPHLLLQAPPLVVAGRRVVGASMRIVVMGSGGTGGYFGAKLARAGEDVTFVARGAHLNAIREHGLRVKSTIEGESVVRAPAVERLDGLPPADLVLFCVKSFDTETAAEAIRPVVGPGTGVLSIQNGVDNEDKLARILGPGHVLGGVAQVFATIEAPGVIAHTLLGRIVFGEMDGAESGRIRAFLAACDHAGIAAEISSNVLRTLWEKYVYLATHSGMTALTRCPAGVLRAVPETRAMYRRLLEEMTALAAAAGAGLGADYVDTCMNLLDLLGPGASSSLHHDLNHGKRLELEAIQGHAVRLGERCGVPTPMLVAVYAALRPYLDGPPAR